MISADFYAIGAILIFTFLGVALGFGRVLGMLSNGIAGKIVSVIVCYFLFGIVLDWQFVQDLLLRFVETLQAQDNFFCNILLKIRIDLIVFAIVLFVIVQVLRILATSVICNLFEADNIAMKIINKTLGAFLSLFVLIAVVLIVFQILAFCGAETVENIHSSLTNSIFGLDKLFLENPLLSIFESFSIAQ